MSDKTGCAVCGKCDTTKWTLNRASKVAIIELCPEHEVDLMLKFQLGRSKPRSTPSDRKSPAQRVKRDRASFDPLDWTPPQ